MPTVKIPYPAQINKTFLSNYLNKVFSEYKVLRYFSNPKKSVLSNLIRECYQYIYYVLNFHDAT